MAVKAAPRRELRGRGRPRRGRPADPGQRPSAGPGHRRRTRPLTDEKGGTMQNINEAAAAFLACKRVAVTGVSRTPKTHGSNNVYRRLRERGYEVFAINPNTAQVEGDRSYPDLASIPGGVEAVVIGTRAEIAEDTLRAGAELGIKHVWMHRGPGSGSVSAPATGSSRPHGTTRNHCRC